MQDALGLSRTRKARTPTKPGHVAIGSRGVTVRPRNVAVMAGGVVGKPVVAGDWLIEGIIFVALARLIRGTPIEWAIVEVVRAGAMQHRQLRTRREGDRPHGEAALAVLRMATWAGMLVDGAARTAGGAALFTLPWEHGARSAVVQAPPECPQPEAEVVYPARMLAGPKRRRGMRL